MTDNLWDDREASLWRDDLALRAYSSRLLGRNRDLVLHGGGNTSVKSRQTTVFGNEIDVLLVKGSGSDLSDIDETGFASLRLDQVARLVELEALSDTEMVEQLRLAATVAGGPSPSVEAILHAVLPHRFVDHTHADAVLTVTNTPGAEAALAEIYGNQVIVVPYVMPGFKLARACAERVRTQLTPGVIGIVLMNHGIFTFGDSAKSSYERMIRLVTLAEEYLGRRAHRFQTLPRPPVRPEREPGRRARADLRRKVSMAFGSPVVMSSHTDEESMRFIRRPDLADISQRGPVTPDHVIRTKPWPLLGRNVDAYVAAYRRYFDEHSDRLDGEVQVLDPAPRVILDTELGMCCIGQTAAETQIVEDVYRHTMKVALDATALGGYRPVRPDDLFDVEYWELEQAKLRRQVTPPPFAGEAALVTGAASGIGRACAAALLAEGATVVGIDVNADIKVAFDNPGWLGIETDVADERGLEDALELAIERFGGLDILVLNAGIFPPGALITELDRDGWRRVMATNVEANALLLREAHPLLSCAPRGGRVVVIGSKNVAAPGPGVAGYSASKTALTQLARVAALEWGDDGIRVNIIHPNAVFDTALWSDDILAERAAHYEMSVEDYRRRNVLGVEVTSADVARLCVAMCGPAFAKTTAAQVPVDGGNDRVI